MIFHPTSIVKRESYLKTGGFSTHLKFGLDTQFLLRAHFYLKIRNVDRFLYIRFKRQNSLTTSKNTKLGGALRQKFNTAWKSDFELIKKGQIELSNSSLKKEDFKNDYKVEKIENTVTDVSYIK